jgi:hypothetical protein
MSLPSFTELMELQTKPLNKSDFKHYMRLALHNDNYEFIGMCRVMFPALRIPRYCSHVILTHLSQYPPNSKVYKQLYQKYLKFQDCLDLELAYILEKGPSK